MRVCDLLIVNCCSETYGRYNDLWIFYFYHRYFVINTPLNVMWEHKTIQIYHPHATSSDFFFSVDNEILSLNIFVESLKCTVFWDLTPCILATRSSEKYVHVFQNTLPQIPPDGDLHIH